MEVNYSLMAILREDPDFAGALAKKKEAVKKDKQNLVSAAKAHTQKYEKEIAEGTKLRQKLLTEGEAQGISAEEVLRTHGQFLPSVQTPILNFLFFMFREESEEVNKTSKLEDLTNYYIEKFGYEGFIKKLEEGSNYTKEVYSEELEGILSEDSNDPVEMDTFIYGNMTHETFKRIKKLKALSHSPNEKEAFQAYRKCLEMCKKYDLNFDKVPCSIK